MSWLISLIDKIPFSHPAAKGHWLYTKVPPSVQERIFASNFKKTVQFAYQHSKFYREKFDHYGIRPSKIEKPTDLGDFFTTADDLRSRVEDFVCLKPDTAFETTGSDSNRPKRVYFSRNEVKEAGWSAAVGFWTLGLRPEDRVASAFDYSFWVSGPILQAACEVIGCFHVEAGRIPPEEFYDRVKDYGITVIVGDPSWIVRFAEVAEVRGPWPLKLLIGGGENLTEDARRYVEKVFKADFILSYGQTEAFGAIGIESKEKDGYHLNEFHNTFEIIHPDAEGRGELVYSTLNRRVMPLIRYRSGDITAFMTKPSRSGIPGRRIEKLKGRVDDLTVTAIGNIAPWIFKPLFEKIPEIGEDWQIVVAKEGTKDSIEFHVESVNGAGREHDVRDRFFSEMGRQLTEAWKIYEMGLLKMDVKLHPKGHLRSGRKLRRIVDKRNF